MVGYLFPGQGSQREGMYYLLRDNEREVREIFEIAKEATGRDVLNVCKYCTEQELKETINTQVSVTAMNIAFARLLRNRGIVPDVVAGHSLGQLSAICVAGVISEFDLFSLVN